MREKPDFLIQRYAGGNWPMVRGDAPFLATGPNFFRYAYPGSLVRYGEHRFVQNLKVDFQEAYGEMGGSISRYMAAWALLESGIVQALWVDHTEVPEIERWGVSVDQLESEIPRDVPIGEAVVEYLSGLSDPAHFRNYVVEDRLELIPCLVP